MNYAFPRARRRDPATSHLAAASMSAYAHMGRIHEALLAHGPAGKDTIASLTGLSPAQVARRLPEMRLLGLVGLTGQTVQSASARAEREWQAIDKEAP